jgi:hypothetical protein
LVNLALGLAAGEQDAEPVVVDVAEPAAGALDLLDQEVGGFDRSVRCAGAVVVQDLGAPAAQRLEEPCELRPGLGVGAPGDGVGRGLSCVSLQRS